MVLLAMLAAAVAVGYLTASFARKRGVPRRSLSATALFVGAEIAVVRLLVFYCAWSLFDGHADWRQGLGYLLLILNALVELGLAAALSGGRPGPPLLVAALIAVTSVLLGFAWAWLRFRLHSDRAA